MIKGEFDKLLEAVGEVFNRLSTGHDGNFYSWGYQREHSSDETKLVLNILRQESDRQKQDLEQRISELAEPLG